MKSNIRLKGKLKYQKWTVRFWSVGIKLKPNLKTWKQCSKLMDQKDVK